MSCADRAAHVEVEVTPAAGTGAMLVHSEMCVKREDVEFLLGIPSPYPRLRFGLS